MLLLSTGASGLVGPGLVELLAGAASVLEAGPIGNFLGWRPLLCRGLQLGGAVAAVTQVASAYCGSFVAGDGA